MTHRLVTPPRLVASALCCAISVSVVSGAAAVEQKRSYDLPSGDAATTLNQFAGASGQQIIFMMEKVKGERTNAIAGDYAARDALDRMLTGTGLSATRDPATGAFVVSRKPLKGEVGPVSDPQPKTKIPPMKSTRTLLAAVTGWLALGSVADAQPTTGTAETPVVLSPFTVQSGANTYTVANAMTGTRINTPLVDAPFAVQVVTDQFLRDVGAGNMTEALRYVSSVRSSANNSENFSIRGFNTGAPLRNYFSVLNGTRTRTENAEYDRIEVLKGPSSLLYGIGGPGGRINTVTKQPLTVTRHSVELETGSYDHYRAAIDLTGPLAAKPLGGELLYRAIAVHQDSEGFRDFELTQRDFLNTQLLWRNSRLSLRAEFRFLRQHENETFILMPIDPGTGRIAWPERSYNTSGPNTYADFREYNGYTEALWTINDRWSLRNGSTYGEQYYDALRRVGAGLIAPAFTNVRNSGNWHSDRTQGFASQTDLTGKIATAVGPLTLVAGHIYESNRGRLQRRDNGNLPSALFPVFDKAARVYSVGNLSDYVLAQSDDSTGDASRLYGMAQLALFRERLLLLAGAGRISSENRLVNRLPATPTSTLTDITKTVPQAGLSYKLATGASIYAMYGESFAPNSRFPGQPEEGKSYELGLKFARELVSGTLALFDTKRENIPANVFDFATNTTVFGVGGKESSRGLEADFYFNPAKRTDVIASYAYLDTEVVTSDNEITRPDRKGTPLANAPSHQGKLWVKHTAAMSLFGFDQPWAGLGLVYVGSMRPDSDPSRYKLIAPSYTRVDLAIGGSRKLGGKLRIDGRIGVENIFNRDYIDKQITRGAPTTLRVSAALRF